MSAFFRCRVCSTLVLMFITASSSAGFWIEGKLFGPESKPLKAANIRIQSTTDSSVIKTAITDDYGYFKMEEVPQGDYLLHASFVGLQSLIQPVTVRENLSLGDLQMTNNGSVLSEVRITATKPLVERQFDKLILNVENSILAAGNSAWDLLAKAPGVVTDQNDQVSLKGRTGVIIMIDGKRSQLAGSDLANYLRSLSSETIQKIEIISNPSARYDAQGSSGIIDIKLVKEKRKGAHATLSGAFGQGRFPKTNNGVTFGISGKKLTIFGNYSFAYRENFNHLVLYRQFFDDKQFTGAYDQDNFIKFNQKSQIARLGLDYKLTSKTDIGLVLNGNRLRFSPRGFNSSTVIDSKEVPASKFNTINRSEDDWRDWGLNLNLSHRFDSTGRELKANLDYAPYSNQTVQNFSTQNYTLTGASSGLPYLLHGDIDGSLNIYSAKVDYMHPVGKIVNLETGVKSSYVKADNNLQFYDRSEGRSVFDSTKSNHFLYSEKINAAYLNASTQRKKWMLQAGIRLENTHVTGKQIVYNTRFTRNYTNLFPNALAAFTANPKNEISLSVSRRLNRPSYNQLNPFKFFLDPTTYKEGNPYLNPMYSWNFELTYTLMQKYSVQLGYSHTRDNIVTIVAPADGQVRVTVQTDKNLNAFDYYGVSFDAPLSLTRKWQSSNSVVVYYGFYRGNLANTPLSNGNVCANINSQNTFQLGKGFSAELTGNLRTKEVYGFMKVKPTGFVTAGIQKHLFDKKATLKLTLNDIFYTNRSRADNNFTGYQEYFDVRRDTRVAVLNLTYRLGTSSQNSSARKQGGAEDEKRRAGAAAG